MTIAIVGEDNAGKTSFIQCALDMKHPPSSYSTKKKMSLDGSVYLVRLLEIDLRKVKYDQSRRILWPRIGKDAVAPRIDGVLLLHDGTEAANFETTSDLVGTCIMGTHKRRSLPSPRLSSVLRLREMTAVVSSTSSLPPPSVNRIDHLRTFD